MPDVTLKSFLPGASVGLYPVGNWLFYQRPPVGSPQGTATATATVDATGAVTFTSVAVGDYYAYDGARYELALVRDAARDGGLPAGGTSGQVLGLDSGGAVAWVAGGGGAPDVSVAVQTSDYPVTAADLAAGNRIIRLDPATAGRGLYVALPTVQDGAVAFSLVSAGEATILAPGGDQTLLRAPRGYRQMTLQDGLAYVWRQGSQWAMNGDALDFLHILDTLTGVAAGNSFSGGAGHRSDIGRTNQSGGTDWFLGTFTGNGGRLEPVAANSGNLKTNGTTNGNTLHKNQPTSRQQRVDVRMQYLTTDYGQGFIAPMILASSAADTGYTFMHNATNWFLRSRVNGTATDLDLKAVGSAGPALPAVNGFLKMRCESEIQADGNLTIRGYVDIEDGNGFQLVCETTNETNAAFTDANWGRYWGMRHASVMISTTVTKVMDSVEMRCW